MRGAHAGACAPVTRRVQMAALGATICNAVKWKVESTTSVSQALCGLTTVAEQPGKIAAGTLNRTFSPRLRPSDLAGFYS